MKLSYKVLFQAISFFSVQKITYFTSGVFKIPGASFPMEKVSWKLSGGGM